jgi:iron complex transport system permease protein
MERVAGRLLGGSAWTGARLRRVMLLLIVVLFASAALALYAGTRTISLAELRADETARLLFFRLRLPRVLMAGMVGASLAMAGAALQALFRNPLADPFTLGVSGGGAVGASIAIAFGVGARVLGVPVIFLAGFGGAMAAVLLVYQIARTGPVMMPGALLLAGVVVNLIAAAAVMTVQYMANPAQAHQILRWMMGSLDVVGFETISQMAVFLIPSWIALLAFARPLHLLAVDEEAAATLGVNVRRAETIVHLLCSMVVGVTVAVGGAVGFVGLIVPHAIRLVFGEDMRIVLPGSLVLGAAFLILADTVARVALGSAELPVGAVTALLGGPVFLWLLRRRQRYTAL